MVTVPGSLLPCPVLSALVSSLVPAQEVVRTFAARGWQERRAPSMTWLCRGHASVCEDPGHRAEALGLEPVLEKAHLDSRRRQLSTGRRRRRLRQSPGGRGGRGGEPDLTVE